MHEGLTSIYQVENLVIAALHEATSTGDPELVQSVLQYRDYQRYMHRTDGIPALLRKIREVRLDYMYNGTSY